MRILVADDEFFARKAIVQMIRDWDESAAVMEAENGSDALKIIDEEIPDLVMTDIRMPGIDGIRLAAHVREQHPSMLVTIISGYDDFTYAREAIQYKVEHYLLKPVDRQELNPLLDQLKLRAAERRENSLEMAVAACFYGEFDTGRLPLEAALGSGSYQTVVFQHRPSRSKELAAFAKETFRKNNLEALMLTDKFQPQLQIAWVRSETNQEEHPLGGLHSICDKINRKLEHAAGEACAAIGASSAFKDLRQLDVSLREAKLAALQSFVRGHRKTVGIGQIVKDYHYDAALIQEWTGAFGRRAANYQISEMAGMIRSWLEDTASKRFSVYMVQDWLAATVNIINTLIGSADHEASPIYLEQRTLFEFGTMREACEELIAKLEKVIGQLKSGEAQGDMVQDIKNFVEVHYKNRIVLEELAKHRYYVDPSYLSRLFKRKCGTGFTQYLLSVRMEKAKKLLETSPLELSVAEVASEVGFNDYSYFIQMYKKFYGATPGKVKNEKQPKAPRNPEELTE